MARGRRLRITFNSPAVLTFVALCVAATGLGYLTDGSTTQLLFETYQAPLTDPFTYVRLIGHVFGHANWEHLLGNMAYVLMLGPLLEEKYGSRTIVWVIALTALVTGVANNLLFPGQALLGASGVCFAFILLSSMTSFSDGDIPLTFILVAVIFLGQQVFQGLTVVDDISNLTHVIGGVIGAIAGFYLGGNHSA